jgi:hypothetical protein
VVVGSCNALYLAIVLYSLCRGSVLLHGSLLLPSLSFKENSILVLVAFASC